jgi:uncharacterized protein YbbC (DUF1343 family)
MIHHGLDRLINDKSLQDEVKGKIGYLCHNASITSDIIHGAIKLKEKFGARLDRLFGPQHGFVTDVQDNMIETNHYVHPYFKMKVYSLYSETRIPNDEMLEGLDTIIIDLQDVGTRVYTYIHTMTYMMEACAKNNIRVVILDRPNPAGGVIVEGNLLEKGFESFVGRHPIPQRHGMTIGEVARLAAAEFGSDCDLVVINMEGYKRDMYWEETGLPYVIPSPNLPTSDGCIVFCGSVLFEGTNISEGRGTTRALEMIGHPGVQSFEFCDLMEKRVAEWGLEGLVMRPIVFMPTFQKHANTPCGGMQVHVTDPRKFQSWRFGQLLCRVLYEELGEKFKWNDRPYEYQNDRLAIDFINGTDKIRHWVESSGDLQTLETLELAGLDTYLDQRSNILLYS